MAVHSVTRGTIEFTADDDILLEVIKVNSFGAFTGGSGGEVKVFSNCMKSTINSGVGVRDTSAERLIWSSGAMNANSVVESAVDVDWAHGLRVEMPSGAKLIAYGE